MIECPFCNEVFDVDELVFEFSWGSLANFLYNKGWLRNEPESAYMERSFYVTMNYDRRGRPYMNTCSAVINKEKHPGTDPLCSSKNEWDKIVSFLRRPRTFETECDDNDRTMPTVAQILPMAKYSKRENKFEMNGMSTGLFCPHCEQLLNPEVLRADKEILIVLSGRPGSGKTVYATQVISELKQGRLAQEFTIEAANYSVQERYLSNKARLRSFGKGFVLATNPGSYQAPYIFLLKNKNSSIRLIIQDIAGEDTENRTKYSTITRKADMVLFFVDPWHIEEIRNSHRSSNDLSNQIVERSTSGNYSSMSGIFLQMFSVIDRSFVMKKDQLAGIMLVKGDYLIPPMLNAGNQPECEMMRHHIPFNKPDEMEFSIGMRSSFVRQCMNEWESAREFSREVESVYPAGNTRYFVCSALGQSTHLRQSDPSVSDSKEMDMDNPDAQFSIGSASPDIKEENVPDWNYGEQVLEAAARSENVIDPIFWCLKRKGIAF